jgi:hypothetical protein
MRSLTRLWLAIEDISDLIALPAVWAEKCGSDDFVRIERFLSPTKDRSSRYPCPYPAGYNCPRLIIGDDGGPFEALCQDPHKICPDLSLGLKDVLLRELDLSGFIKPALVVVGVRNPQLERRGHGVWNVGLAVGGDLALQAAYLLVFGGAQDFAQAAMSLAYELDGPFTIVAPTGRHWTGTLREKLRPPRITFISLNDRVGLDDAGDFVVIPLLTSGDIAADQGEAARHEAGRPVRDSTNKIYGAWIEMGSPRLTWRVCEKLAESGFPADWAKVTPGSKGRKKLRDRASSAVRRAKQRAATKPFRSAT